MGVSARGRSIVRACGGGMWRCVRGQGLASVCGSLGCGVLPATAFLGVRGVVWLRLRCRHLLECRAAEGVSVSPALLAGERGLPLGTLV